MPALRAAGAAVYREVTRRADPPPGHAASGSRPAMISFSVRSIEPAAGHTGQAGPSARSENRCRNHAGSCSSGARDPEPRPGPMPGAGAGQKSDGVFRKMVTRVAA
jgi:hypothetical protein